MWRVITPKNMAQFGKDFIAFVVSNNTEHSNSLEERLWVCRELSHWVCRELSHRTLWQSLQEFISCVESYHTAHCGTVSKRVLECLESYHTANCGTVWQSLECV